MEAIDRAWAAAALGLWLSSGTACSPAGTKGWGGSADASTNPPAEGGAASRFGPRGGALPALRFAVVGDTRPSTIDDTAGYPVGVIDRIYSALASASPSVPFVVSTGDYMFASPGGAQAMSQLELYMSARGRYDGVFFPAMGNHECTGWTDSNCGPAGRDGRSRNYLTFLRTMLAPIGQTKPYYAIGMGAADGSWTCKLVLIAANAWDGSQAAWLSSTLAVRTTYTFVVRHEPSDVADAPGVSPSNSILSRYPYTLLIVGHSHTFEWRSTRELVVGNGGAPLTGAVDFGFGIVARRSDGDIEVDMVAARSLAIVPEFHALLTPDGSSVP